jgi:hypothetical protein
MIATSQVPKCCDEESVWRAPVSWLAQTQTGTLAALFLIGIAVMALAALFLTRRAPCSSA